MQKPDFKEPVWEKEFIRKFFVYKLGGKLPDHVGAEKEAVEFIRSLLAEQKQKVLEIIEEMKKRVFHLPDSITMACHNCGEKEAGYGRECELNEKAKGYNQALDDLKAKIEKL